MLREGPRRPDADGDAEIANSLRKELDDDYRTHRMRLQHAMQVNDMSSRAQGSAHAPIEMTEGKESPYVSYLHVVERDLKQKLGKST